MDNRRDVYSQAEAYPIQSMPPDAPHFGTQVSYSGALMQNLNELATRGQWPGPGWNQTYREAHSGSKTALGNPRLDFINLPYYHPLMGAIAPGTTTRISSCSSACTRWPCRIRSEYRYPKAVSPPRWRSRSGRFPCCRRPAVQWTVVDNIHIDRANQDYDNPGDGLPPPNGADKRNAGARIRGASQRSGEDRPGFPRRLCGRTMRSLQTR